MTVKNISVEKICSEARKAGFEAMSLSSEQRSTILNSMAKSLADSKEEIIKENKKDLKNATALSSAMLDRLTLTDSRFDSMVNGLRQLASFEDRIDEEIDSWTRPNGLKISKIRVPIGVVGIIYESRPNVTADAAGLCIKTSNAVVLRGGKESIHSNRAIIKALKKGGQDAGMPKGMLGFIDSTSRDTVRELVEQEQNVDLVIPRGGEGLIRAVTDMSKVPVLKHYKGVCHIYVDKSADLEKAQNIAINAKCQRPGVCNAMETLIIHRDLKENFLPQVISKLKENEVEIRGDEIVREIDSGIKSVDDWGSEYLDLILSVKVVDDIKQAIEHVNKYGSNHTDAIIAEDKSALNEFQQNVDTGVVMLNASTRFNDGAEFGLGAEIGISTDKLHARGPVGAEGLTSYKYVVTGDGQVRG